MRIYGVLDLVANSLLGGLHLFAHDAVAVRFFSDIAADPQTMVSRQVGDFSLVCLGLLGDENDRPMVMGESFREVLTGAAWSASRVPVSGGE